MSQRRGGRRSGHRTGPAIRALVFVAVVAAGSATAAAPADAAGGITVGPRSHLVDGQTVRVHGSGWIPGHQVVYCQAHPNEIEDCQGTHQVTVGSTGRFRVSIVVQGQLGTVDCTNPQTVCSVFAFDTANIEATLVAVPLGFRR